MTPNGVMTEIFRADWAVAEGTIEQMIYVALRGGAISAWHMHLLKTDHLMVVSGAIKAVQFDNREDAPTKGRLEVFHLSPMRPTLVVIPPGVWHGLQSLEATPSAFVNFFDRIYDPKDPPLPPRREARPRASVAHVALDEIVARSEHRELGEADYRASLKLLDDDLRLVAREWRTFDVEVSNLGTSEWPGGLEARPQIRVGYRWVGRRGRLKEGTQTCLGAPLRPGASAIVPLEVLGPPSVGRHEIEIDLVHEHMRWFGCAIRARIDVRAAAGGAPGALTAP